MVHNCPVTVFEKAICEDEVAEARMARLLVWGLVCPNCAIRVRNALLKLDGVVSADVDWERGLAFVDYIPHETNAHALVRAVGKAGCDADHDFHAAVIG